MSTVEYQIEVKTSGAALDGGTDSWVLFNLIGEDGFSSTGDLVLDNFFHNDFELGRTDTFNITTKDVGLPIIIKIKLVGGLFSGPDEWLCDHIKVTRETETAMFPVYDWVIDEMEVTRGQAILPQNVTNKQVKFMRKREVEQNKSTIQWATFPQNGDLIWGMPLPVKAASYFDLPRIFKRSITRETVVQGVRLKAGIAAAMKAVGSVVCPIDSIGSYHQLYEGIELKRNTENKNYLSDWDTDKGFGRQVLTGINPLMIAKCTSIPSYFNITNADVKPFLNNASLHEEIANGKIYIMDFTDKTTGIKRNPFNSEKKYNCPNSVGLFYSAPNGDFKPIAIQLIPNNRDYLFTPADSADDWLLAKMYLRCSSSSIHEWSTHLLLTHLITEPFGVALFRTLPRSHPIYKMMRPHLRTVAAINTDARQILIPESALINTTVLGLSSPSVVRDHFSRFTMEELNIPKQIKKQKTDDPKLLPSYYYRDDALVLWKIIEDYISGVIKYYYKTDKDVCDDYELQDFANEVANTGLGWQDGNTRGMPEKFTSIDQLIEICLCVVFTSSVQHAAVNFGQYDNYKFVPNSPALMNLPPHKKGEATKERILKSLPNTIQSIGVIAVTYALSEFSPNEAFLGDYPIEFFIDQPILDLQQAYKKALKEAGDKMKARNANLEHPYTFQLPEKVPNYIAI